VWLCLVRVCLGNVVCGGCNEVVGWVVVGGEGRGACAGDWRGLRVCV